MTNSTGIPRFLLVAFLLGGCILAWRLGGPDPILWEDTLNDQEMVRDCLRNNLCEFQGVGASVKGPLVGAAWHKLRLLMEFSGLDVFRVHQILNVLEGMVIPLTAASGWFIGGLPVALASGVAGALVLRSVGTEHAVLYNSRPASFLGALFLLLLVQAIVRRDPLRLMLAASVAALAANFHPVNGFLGVSVVLAGLLFTGRRLRTSIGALGVFMAVLLAGAPWMWLENARMLLDGWKPESLPVGSLASLADKSMVKMTIVATFLSLVHSLWTTGPARARWTTLLLALAPFVLVFAAGTLGGTVERSPKYLVGLAAPVALVLGWTSVLVLQLLLDLATRAVAALRKIRVSFRIPGMTGVAPWVCGALVAILPLPDRLEGFAPGMSRMTLRDVEALSGFLGTDVGWGSTRAYSGLAGIEARELLMAMILLAPLPETGPNDSSDSRVRFVAKVPDARVPKPLPSGWALLRQAGGHSLLVAAVESRLERRRFQACRMPLAEGHPLPETVDCVEVPFVPNPATIGGRPRGMPDYRPGQRISLALRFRFSPDGPTGKHEVRLPRLAHGCSGHRLEVVGLPSTISDDGHRARIEPDRGATGIHGEVVAFWDVGGPGCKEWSYSGFPPILLDGPPEELDGIEALLIEAPESPGQGGRP
jgi:hypothetical protein